ncbi:hypothetical protein [Thermomonas sp.]|uniref:hypothetical protein n=1 Tax=Thermomonas sp. TaxID=1971895 RepID=UPI0035B00017
MTTPIFLEDLPPLSAASAPWVYAKTLGAPESQQDGRLSVAMPEGLAPLDANGVVPPEHLPPPAFVPTLIPAGTTFTVPANTQALYFIPIRIDGDLVVDGTLVEIR